jgi:hypothetical protein
LPKILRFVVFLNPSFLLTSIISTSIYGLLHSFANTIFPTFNNGLGWYNTYIIDNRYLKLRKMTIVHQELIPFAMHVPKDFWNASWRVQSANHLESLKLLMISWVAPNLVNSHVIIIDLCTRRECACVYSIEWYCSWEYVTFKCMRCRTRRLN